MGGGVVVMVRVESCDCNSRTWHGGGGESGMVVRKGGNGERGGVGIMMRGEGVMVREEG